MFPRARLRRGSHRERLAAAASVTLLAVLLASQSAAARRNGIASEGCLGCHSGGTTPKVTIVTSPGTFAPGETVTVTTTIEALNGSTGGMYLLANSGAFSVISGQGTARLSELQIVHSAPRAATGSFVTFEVQWTAPATPGGAYFRAWAVSANANGSASGDSEGSASFRKSFGCPLGTLYYTDLDGDGHGTMDFDIIEACTAPPGFATTFDDCDDNDQESYPGAPERCDQRDNDCNQRIDDGLTGAVLIYPDRDADGIGSGSATSMTAAGCRIPMGFADRTGDCSDTDPAVHPGATEVCNSRDDNCDGRVDEGVRPICGVGWCRRYSDTCLASDCRPGDPTPETCNYADDDCNGVVDDVPSGCGGSDATSGASGLGGGSAGRTNGGSGTGAAGPGGAPPLTATGAAGSGAAGATTAGRDAETSGAPQGSDSGCKFLASKPAASERGVFSLWFLAFGAALRLRRRAR